MAPDRLAAIVPAAGRSSRMGRPKPFLEWQGRTFVETVVERAREIGANPIVVVTNPEHRDLYAQRPPQGCFLVENPEPDLGMFSSLRIGVRSLAPNVSHGIFCPVDCPAIAPATWRRVTDVCVGEPERFVRPIFQGSPGHPVAIPRAFFRRIAAHDGEGGARAFMESFAGAIVDVAVEDAGILRDVDTPEDYRRLT